MRLLFIPSLGKILLTLLFAFTLFSASSQQTLTKIYGLNAYVHLPDDYASGAKRYPVIIFISGLSEIGTDPGKLLEYGPSKLVSQGHNMQFSVNGIVEKPIVISVQPIYAWPPVFLIERVLDEIEADYRVDPSRIYLTGISMGACSFNTYVTASQSNAKRIAAIVSMSSPPAVYPVGNYAWFAASGGKWWGIEGKYDIRGNERVAAVINSYSPGSARYTMFNGGHCCWDTFYDPEWKESGDNVYTWMLKQKLGTGGGDEDPVNTNPTLSAGIDISITLPVASVTLKGSASDRDGAIRSYSWAKVSGPASYEIVSPTSLQTLVNDLVTGTYEFELTVTDDDGAVARDRVKVFVVAPLSILDPVLGKSKDRILIDLGDLSNSAPDRWGKYWNKVDDARSGSRYMNLVNEKNLVTPVHFEVVNRIDGSYDINGTGMNRDNNVGDIGDYPALAVNDNAYAHNSTSTGRWRISGLNVKNEYRVKFWGTRSTSAPRNIEIRNIDEGEWKSFNAQQNRDYNEAAYFKVSGVTEVTFEMRQPAGSQFGNISLIDIAVLTPGILDGLLGGLLSSAPGISSATIQQDGAAASSTLYKAGINVYPNPVIGGDINMTIANRQSGAVTISVLNQVGVVIKTFNYVKQGAYLNQRLSLPDLPKGTYFIKVNMSGYNSVKPFVKL